MNLIRWNPRTGGLVSLQEEMNHLFENLFKGGAWERSLPVESPGWGPPVDVVETPETGVVKAEMPGVNPEEIEISVDGDTLSLRGEKREEKTHKDASVHWVERRYGSFSRSVRLPVPVDEGQVTATSADGVLTVTLPKRLDAKSRRIEVKKG